MSDTAPDLSLLQPGQLIARGTCRLLASHDFWCLEEFVPTRGLRMDVMAIGPKGELWCVECKSSRADYAADSKWQGYLEYCDRFFWAVGPEFPVELLPEESGLILADAFRDAHAHRCNGDDEPLEGLEEADPEMPYWRLSIYLVLGLIGLPLGAHMLVDNASIIARTYGVSDTVIGLTLVAVGTSLPELATTVMAALRRQADVALGNVIGSNMFNLLAIVGIATLFGKIPVDPAFLQFDLWVMLGASLLLIPFVFLGRDITRTWGIALTALYAVYVGAVLM